jgi:hypothetical protein
MAPANSTCRFTKPTWAAVGKAQSAQEAMIRRKSQGRRANSASP